MDNAEKSRVCSRVFIANITHTRELSRPSPPQFALHPHHERTFPKYLNPNYDLRGCVKTENILFDTVAAQHASNTILTVLIRSGD